MSNPLPMRNALQSIFATTSVSAAVVALVGCSSKPNAANIKLREQVQQLQQQVATLQNQHAGDDATIASMKQPGTQPMLTGTDAGAVYTTHGIRLGRATGGADLDSMVPAEDGIKVYVTPFDDDGDDFKAAGQITVEAFDLAADKTAVGKWSFTADEAKKHWNGQALQYEYILPCPWQEKPTHPELTLRVTFVDSLTGRSFSVQKIVKINPPK